MSDDEDGIDEETVVIIDNGSGDCKIGLSTGEQPKTFPEVIGKPRKNWKSTLAKDAYFGHEVIEHGDKLAVSYPLENGIIENFENMELLWEHVFIGELDVDPSRHPVLLTEPPYNPKPNREKMVEIMFETFGVPALNISIQGVLALLGQGRTTGLVLDSGEGVTHTIPVYDGYGLTPGIMRLDLAGRELNTLLAKLLAKEGYCLTTTTHQHHVRKMKEKYGYCSLDPSSEFAETVHYELPDGQKIPLGDERWKSPEALFNPSLIGLESPGVGGIIWESISRCDIHVRKTLLSNIVLSGGSTMFPGFSERVVKELRNFAPTASQANIRIVQSKDQKNAVWTGAQVFASLRSMQEDQWMTIEDYDEYGAASIHDKIAVKYG